MHTLRNLEYAGWSVEAVLRSNRKHLAEMADSRPQSRAAIGEGLRAIDQALEILAERDRQ